MPLIEPIDSEALAMADGLNAEQDEVAGADDLDRRVDDDRLLDDGSEAESDGDCDEEQPERVATTVANATPRPYARARPMTKTTLGPGFAIRMNAATANPRR
ncbi:hypothetical protein [Aeromicrobium sp.]